MGKFLTDDQFNLLGSYLSQRPWREVVQLMEMLKDLPTATATTGRAPPASAQGGAEEMLESR
jgi:hypothetical protein